MLLVIDVGNTNVTFGLFKGKKLVKNWRCVTKKVGELMGLGVDGLAGKVDGVIVASVVPEIDARLRIYIHKKIKVTPLFVTYKNAGIKIAYPRPTEIGADRLVDAVAAWKKYKRACIVVDFGTATTLDYIDDKGRYYGGPIAPGISIANDALFEATSKLPKAGISRVKKIIPKTTKMAMQAGVYIGYLGLVEKLIGVMQREVGGRPLVIATGGLAPLISGGTKVIDKKEPHLTLEGLKIIWELNQ